MVRVIATLSVVLSGCLIVGYEPQKSSDGGDRSGQGDSGDGDSGDGDSGDGDSAIKGGMDARMPPGDGAIPEPMPDAAVVEDGSMPMPDGGSMPDAAVNCSGGCDDGDPCTTDSCTGFGCAFETVYPACEQRGDCPAGCDYLYALSDLGQDCNSRCAALGLACAGSGNVGSECRVHREVDRCNDTASWIYRDWLDAQRCASSWGDSRVCDYNYNIGNAFCCRCQAP